MPQPPITLGLGLVILPVKSTKAIDTAVSMKTLCVGQPGGSAHDAEPITQPKSCPICGPITDFPGLKKGVPTDTGYAVVETEDIAAVRADTSEKYKRKFNLVPHEAEAFYAATAQGPSLNYIEPLAGGEDHYQLLTALIAAHPEYAFATMYTPVSRANLYVARVREGVIVMEQRVFNERLRPVPVIGGAVNDALLAQFEMLLPTMVQPVDKDTYTDTYEKALADVAAASTDTLTIGSAGPAKPATIVGDDALLAKLQELTAATKEAS